MIIVVLVAIMKTLFFMRIFTMLSPIVKRLLFVMIKIKNFMIFFCGLILFFSAIFNVISRNEQAEYKTIGYFFGGLLYAFRLSIGDFNFELLKMSDEEKIAYKL